MRIEFNKDYPIKDTVEFDDLEQGEAFEYECDYYIKTDEDNAVRVRDGYIDDNIDCEEVKRITATFLVRSDK